MNPRRGEVWMADLGMKKKVRPIVILSRDDPDPPRKITTYVPITEQNRGSPYEVPLPKVPFLSSASTANLQGIASDETSDKDLFLYKKGDLPDDAMKEIEKALLYAVGMS